MTIPDSPALDLDALTALEKAATPAPWSLEHEGGCIVFGPESSVAEADPADAALIVAMRNQWPALLSALAAARAERDHYLRSFKAQQAENERVHAKVREQYDVIEHAKKQRDEARREVHLLTNTEDGRLFVAEQKLAEARAQAKQAQGELAEVTRERDVYRRGRDAARAEADGLRVELRDALIAQRIVAGTLGATSTAAPQATCSCQWSPVQGRIWCDSCATARDAVVEATAAPQADDLPGMWEQADLTGGQTDAKPVPAGGEDGSGTADDSSEERCVCGPTQYCHLDNCQGVDGPGGAASC